MEKDINELSNKKEIEEKLNNNDMSKYYEYENVLITFTTDLFYNILNDHKKDFGGNLMGKL